MERMFLYILAIANISVGFMVRYRSTQRFGFDTYRSFLDRVERSALPSGSDHRRS